MSGEAAGRGGVMPAARDTLDTLSWTLARLALGLILAPHGWGKLFGDDLVNVTKRMVALGLPAPTAWAYWIGLLEFAGGIMLALGLYTRVVAALIAIEMAVVSFAVLAPNWFWTNRGMEYSVMMMLFAICFTLRGGGPLSIDRLMGRA